MERISIVSLNVLARSKAVELHPSTDAAVLRWPGRRARLATEDAAAGERSQSPLLRGLGGGDPTGLSAKDTTAQAVIDAFAPGAARADLLADAQRGQLGDVILRTLVLLEEGAAGNPRAITQALGTLRALGFEDTMRRASLQILLLERFG